MNVIVAVDTNWAIGQEKPASSIPAGYEDFS